MSESRIGMRGEGKGSSEAMLTATKPQPEAAPVHLAGGVSQAEEMLEDSREWQAQRLRLLWDCRAFFFRMAVLGLTVSTLVVFLIPNSYTSTAQLMPPDPQSAPGLAMMAAMAGKSGASLGAVAGDFLGLKSSGALLIGVLRSQTSEDRLIQKFDLRKVYGRRLIVDARAKLDENTSISEDRKSGIITLSVTDRSPQQAAALASAYIDQLNALVSELSTSSAHRERVFLEERLKVAKRDLDAASDGLAQFSSRNSTLDIQQEGKAMLDAAGTVAGEMIAAQAQLEGLRQIYADNHPRVRSLNARVAELRKQLETLGGSKTGNASDAAASSGASVDPEAVPTGGLPFPSIRSLPLLGAKYADYYRRAKIQETVYELLTEQYELAKVQEAKETPSVKILDPATVPEKKSFPPRLEFMFLGTSLVATLSVVGVLGLARWEEVDPADPRMILAREVVGTLKGQAHCVAQNERGLRSVTHGIWNRLGRRPPNSEPADH